MGTWAPTSSHPTFNGGTITTALRVDPTSDNTTALRIDLPSDAIGNQTDYLDLRNQNGTHNVEADASGNFFVDCRPSGSFAVTNRNGVAFLGAAGTDVTVGNVALATGALAAAALTIAGGSSVAITTPALGLFASAAASQPVVTSGTVTPEQLALALQTYGALGGT